MDSTIKLAFASILVGITVLFLKSAAFVLTGSVALYSDALESVINVVTAVAAFIAIRLSAKPADREHPYGHHKAEYLSAVLEGVLIAVAALLILREAYFGLLTPEPLDAPLSGLAVNGLASVLNAVWSCVLIRHGRRTRSPALVADGRHLLADVFTSVGVLAGVAVATLTGWAMLDPVLAALVALHILWIGYGLMKESVGGLMDSAAPPDVQARIRGLISSRSDGALEAHDLRTRHAGRVTFIDFHLVVPSEMTVTAAHEICDRIERALISEMGEAVVTIHIEPAHKAKQGEVLVI